MATVYFPDGRTKQVKPSNGNDFSLNELRDALEFGDGDYIEVVYLHNTSSLLIINEEGKLKNLLYNAEATNIWFASEGSNNKDYIVGPALHCKLSEVE